MSGLDDAPEIIVVLGGGLLPDGSPDAATLRRAEAAAALAHERPHAAVIASGGGPLASDLRRAPASARPQGPEAAHIARILRQRGIDERRIHLEDESMDTLGNAVFTAARYLKGSGPRPLWLVTSPFHLDRAVWLFTRVLPGWDVTGHSAAAGPEDAPRSENEATFRAHNEAMLTGVADGDLGSMFDRLVARWSEYARYASRVR